MGESLLIEALERLMDTIWTAEEPEGACRIRASHFCDLIGTVGKAVANVSAETELRYNAALKAFWADKARGFVKPVPQDKYSIGAINEHMAIASAAVGISAKRGELLRLFDCFAMEFVKLALAFYEPRVDGGEVVFECRDFIAAKKRTEALKRLARSIDEFANFDCDVKDIHKAIIAYFNQEVEVEG